MGSWVTDSGGNHCVDTCAPVVDNQTVSCLAPQTGTITQNRTSTYCGPSNTLASQTAWVYASDTCVSPALGFCDTNICVNGGNYINGRCEKTTYCTTGPTSVTGTEYYNIDTSIRNGGSGCPAATGWMTATPASCSTLCPNPPPPNITSCGSGFNIGNITTTYNVSPAPACTQSSSTSNNCACSLTATTSSAACGAGYQPGS